MSRVLVTEVEFNSLFKPQKNRLARPNAGLWRGCIYDKIGVELECAKNAPCNHVFTVQETDVGIEVLTGLCGGDAVLGYLITEMAWSQSARYEIMQDDMV